MDRYLKDKDMDHIDHALGRPVDPMGKTYRNRFAIDGRLAEQMAASPHWEEFGRTGDMRFFGVTDEGRKALVQYLSITGDKIRKFAVEFEGHTVIVAAASPAKARYAQWLDVSDYRPDLTFFDYCRKTSVRRAA
ncbi:hypothetical protein V5F44_20500 [Xanthobacter sp. V2C-8]|uniref:hypothetical protein n=1 Tax=Xanthobacter albus TaxID=3119929 RepID=UPI0037267688